jgi:2-C-methyl-D-erythritol 4-phosphate cytidylyltransferase/2-C-methyl-D-erythritol 2,4-cyclodiphosphate synthase
LVLHTLAAFAAVPAIAQTTVVVAPGDGFLRAWGDAFTLADCGGASRARSVLNGLHFLRDQGAAANDWVLVHDAARCLVTPAQIEQLIAACAPDSVGGLLALPLADTLKSVAQNRVQATLSRHDKWLAQTPQMFRLGQLIEALTQAGDHVTDEASAIEALGLLPLCVPGSAQNFKLTYPADFVLAEQLLLARRAHAVQRKQGHMNFRIGEGWDVHALVPGRALMLGGVHVPFELGLQGHSDADVLLHAITDAVLGAAALGDIGRHFPDTEAQWKGADSWCLLQEATRRLRAAGFEIANVDSTVIAQAPKLMAHLPAMCVRVAQALGVAPAQVNVKAKTAEKMGPVGLGLAIEARASALVYSVRD